MFDHIVTYDHVEGPVRERKALRVQLNAAAMGLCDVPSQRVHRDVRSRDVELRGVAHHEPRRCACAASEIENAQRVITSARDQ